MKLSWRQTHLPYVLVFVQIVDLPIQANIIAVQHACLME